MGTTFPQKGGGRIMTVKELTEQCPFEIVHLGNPDAVLQYEGTTDETTTEKGSTTEKKETTEKQDTTEQNDGSANKDGIPNVVGLHYYAARDKLWDCEQIDNIYGGNIVLLNA